MRPFHRLLTSAICVAAFVVSSELSVSAQANDLSYSGSNIANGYTDFLPNPNENDDNSEPIDRNPSNERDLAVVEEDGLGYALSMLIGESDDEENDTEESDDDTSADVVDSEEKGPSESPIDLTSDLARRLKSSTTPSKPKSPPSKPTKPKPTHRPKPRPTPTPTVTPVSTPEPVTDIPAMVNDPPS